MHYGRASNFKKAFEVFGPHEGLQDVQDALARLHESDDDELHDLDESRDRRTRIRDAWCNNNLSSEDRDLSERLQDLFVDFEEDDVDPLMATVHQVQVGLK